MYSSVNTQARADQSYILIMSKVGYRKRIPAPMWLQASGPKHHSDVQLKSGENLASLKRKYKQSLCLYCAGNSPLIYQLQFYLHIYMCMYVYL
jgi:hypothetical protein